MSLMQRFRSQLWMRSRVLHRLVAQFDVSDRCWWYPPQYDELYLTPYDLIEELSERMVWVRPRVWLQFPSRVDELEECILDLEAQAEEEKEEEDNTG